jgi:hypothetical protein
MIPEAQAMVERHAGVVGIGFGMKERGGALTDVAAIRVYVRAKSPVERLLPHERIPAMIGGLPTDVIEHSPAMPAAGTRAGDPMPGARIANAKGVPGTLGCYGRRTGDHAEVLLTSWHVLFGAGAREHSRIWLIEERDGARQTRAIGHSLYGSIGTVTINGEEYHIDCAVGSSHPVGRRRHEPIHSQATAMPGERVTKTGSATGKTAGIVVDVSYPDLAVIENRTFAAPRQVLVRSLDPAHAFSSSGDSGAAVLNERGEIVALLWGTNCRGEGVACHIQPILQTLQVQLEPRPPVRLRDRIAHLFRRREALPCN